MDPTPDRDPCTPETRPCGLGRRALAMVYDALLVVALLMVATALALPVTRGQVVALRDPGFTAYLVVVAFLYFALFWRRGQTLGMRAWRVHLLTRDGTRLSWPRCAARFAVAALSAAAAGLGFLWAWSDPQRRAWHDRASGSRLVVKAKGA